MKRPIKAYAIRIKGRKYPMPWTFTTLAQAGQAAGNWRLIANRDVEVMESQPLKFKVVKLISTQ